MNLDDIMAVIHSAKARGPDALNRYIRQRLPEASDAQVQNMSTVAEEIIDTIPVFLARAEQAAEERGLEAVVSPILAQATRYFLTPVDVIPEMTLGLPGLLDDAYLVLRLLEHLDGGAEPFLDWELREPIEFLSALVGRETTDTLDLHTQLFIDTAEVDFVRLWDSRSAEA